MVSLSDVAPLLLSFVTNITVAISEDLMWKGGAARRENVGGGQVSIPSAGIIKTSTTHRADMHQQTLRHRNPVHPVQAPKTNPSNMAAADILINLPNDPITVASSPGVTHNTNGTTKHTSPFTTPLAKDACPFNPAKHLNFTPPSRIYTMEDIGLPRDTGVSPLAVSEPFPLFTQEAVMRMREEILSKEVAENCQYSSNLAKAQLRGYAERCVSSYYLQSLTRCLLLSVLSVGTKGGSIMAILFMMSGWGGTMKRHAG